MMTTRARRAATEEAVAATDHRCNTSSHRVSSTSLVVATRASACTAKDLSKTNPAEAVVAAAAAVAAGPTKADGVVPPQPGKEAKPGPSKLTLRHRARCDRVILRSSYNSHVLAARMANLVLGDTPASEVERTRTAESHRKLRGCAFARLNLNPIPIQLLVLPVTPFA